MLLDSSLHLLPKALEGLWAVMYNPPPNRLLCLEMLQIPVIGVLRSVFLWEIYGDFITRALGRMDNLRQAFSHELLRTSYSNHPSALVRTGPFLDSFGSGIGPRL